MSRTFTDLWKEASELSDEDRAALAGLLIESLEGEPDPDVEAAWAAEIEKRVAELDAGSVQSIPWEQVRQRLLERTVLGHESVDREGAGTRSNGGDDRHSGSARPQ
jgi:putative addiction module component (TIGR02574 family)